MQHTHYSTAFTKQKFPIVLISDRITNAPNIGSLFRIADAFGIETLVFCGDNTPIGRRMAKTSRSTEKYVNYKVVPDAETEITRLKAEGYRILAVEITNNSQPLHKFKIAPNTPYVIVIGNENYGISETVLAIVDAVIHIDMYGENSSMNVTQAASIVLYEMTKQMSGSAN